MRRIVIALAVFTSTALACDTPPAVDPDASAPAAAEEPGAEPAQAQAEPQGQTPAEGAVDQANLPPAEQVLEKSVVAVGGRDKIDSIKSYYKEERTEIPAQNMTATSKFWWKQGNMYSEIEMPGVGLMKVWHNDEGTWSQDPLNGTRKLEGDEAEQAARTASPVMTAVWKEYFDSAETTGRRMVDDRPVIDVKLTDKKGEEMVLSFDEAEGLLVEQQFKQKTAMGDMPVTVKIEEWADYDGYKDAKVTVADMKVMKVTTKVTKYELNPEVDDSKFLAPAQAGGKSGKKKSDAKKTKKK
jgi:hypothetical protein